MRDIKVETVDPGIEKLIVTGMIVDTKFLSEIYMASKPEFFKGTFTRMIAEWCREFFIDHRKAPGKTIQDIFTVKVGTESGRDAEDVDMLNAAKSFLSNLSADMADTRFNSDYVLLKAFPYLQANMLDLVLKKSQKLATSGDSEGALKVIRDSGKDIFTKTVRVVDFPNIDELIEIYEMDRVSLFDLPGDLGKYMGPFRRAKLIVFLAPTKRGKTHWLVELAVQAVFSGLKVALFSLELTKEEIQELIVTRFLNKEFGDGSYDKGKYRVPVFDCVHNQTGECILSECRSPDSVVIDLETGLLMEWDKDIQHTPCCECLRRKELRENFELSSWFIEMDQDVIKSKDLHSFIDDFIRQKGTGSLKIKAYPISTATISDVENDLDKEEAYNQWIPDILVIDSLDNFKKNIKLGDKRIQLGEIWEESSKITKSRNLLTFSATQGNRGSFLKDRLEVTDVAEDFSKAMVVDALFAINERGGSQTDPVLKDSYWKRQEIECLLHRGKKIVTGQQCMVLQNFELGQVILSSKLTRYTSLKGGK
jgi:hypothetical protein